MEDSRFAEASRRVYLFLFCLEGLGGWEVYCAGGRVGGWKSKVAKKGSEYRQTDNIFFRLIKKQDFL